jgi:GTPase SAR1 family protein
MENNANTTAEAHEHKNDVQSGQSTESGPKITVENPWPNFGEPDSKPIVCVLIGMAGSGKTTLMQRINAHVHTNKIPSYIINLDPAVATVPYSANIDIRDSLNYKEVMKQYNLGPNGGILTSLNLFATRFDQVMDFVEKRAPKLKYIFIDTPGQIEVFNWSASGTIITEAFSSQYPTVFIFVVDTPRSSNPATFMSNMLYACSILYKTKLPLLVVFNKCDVVPHDFALEWMKDFDKFEEAARAGKNYMAQFTQSMGLMLQEFYENLSTVGVSAVTGAGMEQFFNTVSHAAVEYETYYKVDLLKKLEERKQKEKQRQEEQLTKLKEDIMKTKGEQPIDTKAPRRKKFVDADMEYDVNVNLGGHLEEESDEEEGFDPAEYETERQEYEEFMRELSGNK